MHTASGQLDTHGHCFPEHSLRAANRPEIEDVQDPVLLGLTGLSPTRREANMKIVGFCSVLLLALPSHAFTASDRTVGVRPSDGTVSFAKAFQVPAGTWVAGVTFANNDPGTTFPQVLLLRGVTSALAGGELLRTA